MPTAAASAEPLAVRWAATDRGIFAVVCDWRATTNWATRPLVLMGVPRHDGEPGRDMMATGSATNRAHAASIDQGRNS